jgi:hypothetical protein
LKTLFPETCGFAQIALRKTLIFFLHSGDKKEVETITGNLMEV